MQGKPKIFISYAREDGEKFATDLLNRLQLAFPQFDFWQDRSAMQGGLPWWVQIAGAIEHAHALILVITPAAMRSASVKAELRSMLFQFQTNKAFRRQCSAAYFTVGHYCLRSVG
jgi:hypothetical protein